MGAAAERRARMGRRRRPGFAGTGPCARESARSFERRSAKKGSDVQYQDLPVHLFDYASALCHCTAESPARDLIAIAIAIRKQYVFSRKDGAYPMIKLTGEMIIEIHDTVIHRYGGLPGVLCRGTLDYLVERINGESDHFKKAAIAIHLIALHPFNDGQKRTGFQVADNILRLNGLCISASKETTCSMLRRVAEYECTIDAIELWLRENTQTI